MTTLKRKDVRTLGYFSFGIAAMCLLVLACSQGVSGWLSVSLSSYAMLAIVLIASANDPEFQRQNPWLVRFVLAGMILPAIGVTVSGWFSSEFSIWGIVAALVPPSVAIASFIWYRHAHGVEAEVNSQ